MDTNRYDDLVLRHALGDLTDDERRELAADLLSRGADARAEVDALREAFGSISLMAEPVTPPAELRGRLMSRLDGQDGDAIPLHAGRSGSDRPTVLWPLVAIAAVLAAIALGLNTVRMQRGLTDTRAELEMARAEAGQARILRDSLSALVADVSTIASANAVTLSGTSPEIAGRARVFVDVETGRTLLLVDDLPVLPPGQVYQLWAIRGETPTSAGAFRLEAAGPAWIHMPEDADLSTADLLAVTVEQAPGATAPTSNPILAGGS